MSTPGKNLPDDGIGALTTLTVAVLFTGFAFPLLSARTSRCAGATRSMRLQFEQQKAAMQQAAEDENKPTDECHD